MIRNSCNKYNKSVLCPKLHKLRRVTMYLNSYWKWLYARIPPIFQRSFPSPCPLSDNHSNKYISIICQIDPCTFHFKQRVKRINSNEISTSNLRQLTVLMVFYWPLYPLLLAYFTQISIFHLYLGEVRWSFRIKHPTSLEMLLPHWF